jgi:chromosome segregation ATPase
MELGEVQAQLEEAQRFRADAEERAGAATRERADIRTQLEENEEELAEVVLSHCIYVSYFENGFNCKKNCMHILDW